MSPILITFVIIAIAAIAIPLVVSHSKRINQSWLDAAHALGLSYQPGGFLRSRQIVGSYKGFPVVVDTYTQSSGKNSTTYTRFCVRYPQSLGLGLRMSREGLLSGFTKLFGAQDIQVGDASFDSDVMVKGADASRVRQFLTSARRVRIHRLLSSYSGATIDDNAIRWQTRGVVAEAPRIVSIVHNFARLGWHLIDARESDHVMEIAMDHGRPDEALSMLEQHRESSEENDLDAPGSEEKMMEGELLYLGGRTDDAKRAFQQARAQAPDDPEIRDWAEQINETALASAGTEAAAVQTNEVQVSEADSETDKGDPDTDDDETRKPSADDHEAEYPLDVQSVCNRLFGEDITSFEANRTFEQHYAGRTVRWSGTLEEAESSSYDFVFKQRNITKAVVAIGEVESTMFSDRKIFAVVHLANIASEDLDSRVGAQLTFDGKLVKLDGFMRNAYVGEGSLVQ